MDKDRAAAAGNTRPGVVVDLDKNVVEVVVPPQPVAPLLGRPPKGAVVTPIGRIFAPGISPTDPV
jgi:hypothetical protein